ncbi:hypothetical protein F4820DRAFT_432084 [Hypoxylon rubiginosum]|uniref:Uncharacterized protein n=1 Tax=Hypoxylon rubiginosum TaxID=110542 RepID=A0ACB9YRY7_9PEZI|nr:hypothetical protein F4820DRAFT_432084 [Hypoxylon rubiginosum]
MSVQDLARSLAAVGSAKLPSNEGHGLYLLSVRDGNLVEKFWVGHALQNETVIASDARDGTSASYLLGLEEDPRRVFYIDQENSVQCYAYDEEMEEWEETPLGGNWNITTCPQSKLSANYGLKGEVVVSYQDETGRLAGIISVDKDEWEAFGPLEGNPASGTPQCLDVINDKLHLFYVEKGGGISYLVLDPDTGDWQANLLMDAGFDTPVDNFSIAQDPETGSFHGYFLTGGSLWNANEGKEKVCLGKVQGDGKLIPSTTAQAGWFVRWRRLRRVRKIMERNDVFYHVVVHHVALPPQKMVARRYYPPAWRYY